MPPVQSKRLAETNRLPSALSAASSTTGPESVSERDGMQLPSKNPSSWSIEEVMQFVRDADPTALAPHAELFRKHVRLHWSASFGWDWFLSVAVSRDASSSLFPAGD